MTLTDALRHEWILPPGTRLPQGNYDNDDRWTRDSTAGLVDTPRLDRFDSSMQSTDDFSQPMRGLNLQTPGRLAQNRRNFFSLDSSQGQLAGQSSVFDDHEDAAQGPRDMYDSQQMDCEEDGAQSGSARKAASPVVPSVAHSDRDTQRPPTDMPASVPDTQARSQAAGAIVASEQGASQFPNSIPDTQGNVTSSVAQATGEQVEDLGRPSSGQMDVEVELPGPDVEPEEHERLCGDDDADHQDRKRRESSSPLSSCPPSQDPLALVPAEPQNGKTSKRKQADHLTIETDTLPAVEANRDETVTQVTPGVVTPMTTNGRALRSRMTSHQPSKQKAEEIESPRPKKRAATIGTRSQVAAPAVDDVKASESGSTRTRSSARLRKR